MGLPKRSKRYAVYSIRHDDTPLLIGFSSVPYASHWLRSALTRAQEGVCGAHLDAIRAVLALGERPSVRCEAAELTKDAAKALKTALQDKHGITGRRAVPCPRIHKQWDPNSPDLDPSPVYYVYELIRPDTGAVFYIGKGSERHAARVSAHICAAKNGKRGHKFSIIRKLLKAVLAPQEHRVLEHVAEDVAFAEETRLLDQHGLTRLTNDAPGGQGPPTGDDHWTRRHPERVLRGDQHPGSGDAAWGFGSRQPKRRPRGESHGMCRLSDADVSAVRARFESGEPAEQIGTSIGISGTHVGRLLRGARGGKSLLPEHGNRKVSAVMRSRIRARLAAGETGVALSNELGVSTSLISYIRREDQ